MSLLRRKRKNHIFRTPRFFRWFRRNTEAVFSRGNRVELFNSGGDIIDAMLEGFAAARHTICAEFYIIRNDPVGNAFADALIAAAARGVRVRLLYDYIGSFDTPGAYFRRLERGGVACVAFNPPPFRNGIGWFDRRDHRKMAVVDGIHAFVGGINIGEEYAGRGEDVERWRDAGMSVEGAAARELQRLFMVAWQDESGITDEVEPAGPEPPRFDADASVMIVTGSPHHNRSFIRSAFMLAIAGASDTVRILTPYFVPGPRFVRSLLRAVRRGVRVQLVLPALNDVPLVRLVSRSYYAPLLKAGIEIYEREGTVLHAKLMLIDDCWGMIGSANLDLRSFHRNYELNVIVDSHEFGRQLNEAIEEDLSLSRRILLHEHESRGVLVRFMERIFAPASWFL